MMRRVAFMLVMAQALLVHALAPSGADAGAPVAAAFARGAAAAGSNDAYKPLANGANFAGDVEDDDEFEFDLDLSSKQKLQRQHHHLDGEDTDDAVEVVPSIDGETRAWIPSPPQPDVSTKVKPSGFNYGRGVGYVTTQEVTAGDVLFSVPFVEVMTLQSARQGRVRALLDANPDLPSSIALALHLLEETFRGEDSRFHTYIESLPHTTAAMNSTIFYNEEEMELLRGSHLFRTTQGRLQGLASFHEALLGPVTSLALNPPLFTKDQFTTANFAWAMGTVWARAFALSGDENDVVIAPILDTIGVCLDDDCPKTHVEWDTEAQRLVVYATQDYDAGEEVLLDLGANKPSTLLMLNHGFARVNPTARVEALDVSIFLDPNDTLLSVKSHLLESNNMSLNGSYTLRYKSSELDATMVKSLKLKLLAAPELDKYHVLVSPPSTESAATPPVVSLRNEYVFTRAVVMTCKNLLAQYVTPLESDRAQVQQLESRYRERRAGVADRKLQLMRALVIEKEILHHTMQLALAKWNDLVLLSDPSQLGF